MELRIMNVVVRCGMRVSHGMRLLAREVSELASEKAT
jgi:hypothetical protein